MRSLKLWFALLAVTILIVACDRQETPTPAPTVAPVEVPTQAPTEEPTPPPTAEPTLEPQPTKAPVLADREHVPDPALIDVTWQWERRTNNGGAEVLIAVPNPENYTIVFNADGSFNASLDCNNAGGNYATDGTGGIFMELGPMTRVACPPDSLADDMADMFGSAQNYSFEEDGQVVIFKWVAAGPWDTYRRVDSSVPAAGSELVGATWQWQAFQDTAEVNDLTVPDPENYTLTLLPDGTATLQADCNRVSWTYTLEGSSLTFNTLGPATLAFCGEESLDQQYLAWLGDTATYVIEGGQLFLNLKLDAGNMVFGRGGLGLSPEQISLDAQDLPAPWQAVIVPETPYDKSMPPGPMGLPEHIEILFGSTDPAQRQFGDPVMYIIPVNAYRQLWDEAGDPSVPETMAQIERLSYLLPSPAPVSGLATLPVEERTGVNDLAAQVGRTGAKDGQGSATQDGYRFVGRWMQDANPVTNERLRYVYQGFTNDGQYLVSFWYPVSTPALPDDVSSVPAEELEQFNSDFQGYMTAQVEALNALSPSDWQPDLETLDALVASLQIEGMPVAGIQDKTWLWTEGPVQPGDAESVTVEDPEKYQVVYGSDGVINFVADCNSGSMSYELRQGGMFGSMLAGAGPMTLAECGPDSLYQGFANSLMAAQDYRLQAGGDHMELVLPAGGGVLKFTAESTKSTAGMAPPEKPLTDAGAETAEELPPDLIQIDVEGLAKTYAWEALDAIIPEEPGPGAQAYPAHILLTFDDEDPQQVLAEGGRRMYLFPVEDYIKTSASFNQPLVIQQIERLQQLIAGAEGRQEMPGDPMSLLPPPNSLMDRWVQFLDLNFVDGKGVRYVSDSPTRQAIGPLTNETTDYYYQGLTDDGRYYISLIWPVSTASLPDTPGDVPGAVLQQATNPQTYPLYLQETKDALNGLATSAWLPDLAELDAMVASLRIKAQ